MCALNRSSTVSRFGQSRNWVTSRSLAVTSLALATVVLGLASTLGVLAWLGQPLNPANLLAFPLLLGLRARGS